MTIPVRVIIADDHEVVRHGLRQILLADPQIDVVAQACDGVEACELAAAHQPDVVILDVSMPRMNGRDATARLLQVSPATKVIALTMHEDFAYVRELFDAGAHGYVLKRSAVRDLLQAIDTVRRGHRFIDAELSRGAGHPAAPEIDGAGAAVSLSKRETEVASLSACGHTQAEIAARLSIAVKTVESHKAHLMTKLGLKTRAELVRYAIFRGWLAR